MPVATQNKITRSCGLSVVVGLSITYPSPAPWEGCDRRLTRRRREGDVLLSALQRQNNAEQNALVWTHLPWSADVSATIGRDHIVDLVVGNRRPRTVHFNFVMVANHAALGRPTIHQVAARASAIISFEFRVEVAMPFIVAYPVVSFLRRRAYTKKHGDRAAEQRDEVAAPHSITSSARRRNDSGILRPSALAVVRLMTRSNLVGCSTGISPGLIPRRILSVTSAALRNVSDKFGP